MKSKYDYLLIFLIFMLCVGSSHTAIPEKFQKFINKGEFSKAQEFMREEIAVNLNLSLLDRLEIIFEIERLERIKKDFTRSSAEVIDYIKKYIPDATYGLLDSKDDDVKWFYLGNMENYRLIVNDDYTQPLYPAKIYPRSDTVDFQRGEVEWEGGNLFFDQWDYNYEVEFIK